MDELCIRGVRLGNGEIADIAIESGFIARIASDLPRMPGVPDLDGRGCLVIPGLVDGHAHLDKCGDGLAHASRGSDRHRPNPKRAPGVA